jgi:hypothetical protein
VFPLAIWNDQRFFFFWKPNLFAICKNTFIKWYEVDGLKKRTH